MCAVGVLRALCLFVSCVMLCGVVCRVLCCVLLRVVYVCVLCVWLEELPKATNFFLVLILSVCNLVYMLPPRQVLKENQRS